MPTVLSKMCSESKDKAAQITKLELNNIIFYLPFDPNYKLNGSCFYQKTYIRRHKAIRKEEDPITENR